MSETTSTLRVHLVQPNVEPGKPDFNRRRVDELISQAYPSPGDIILLPELFSAGILESRPSRDDAANAEIEDRIFLADLARRTGCEVIGGVLGANESEPLNLSLRYNDQGACVAAYAKIHPFTAGREHEFFASGQTVVQGRLGPFSWQPLICYDLRFPEPFRLFDEVSECFTVQAAWPLSRQMHWDTLIRARAIENQAYVLGVNVTGRQGRIEYGGGSVILTPRGETLVAATTEETVLTGELHELVVRSWRKAFPALRDRKAAQTLIRKSI